MSFEMLNQSVNSINRKLIRFSVVSILLSMSFLNCKFLNKKSEVNNLSRALPMFQRNHPERRKLLVEKIKTLGIQSFVGNNSSFLSEEEDLMFRFSENNASAYESDLLKFVKLQGFYKDQFLTEMNMGLYQRTDNFTARSPVYVTFSLKADSDNRNSTGKISPMFTNSYAQEALFQQWFKEKNVGFRIILADSITTRANVFDKLPVKLEMSNCLASCAAEDSLPILQAKNHVLKRTIGAGGFGKIFTWSKNENSDPKEEPSVLKVYDAADHVTKLFDLSIINIKDQCSKSVEIKASCQDLALPIATGKFYDATADQYFYGQWLGRLKSQSLFDRLHTFVQAGNKGFSDNFSHSRMMMKYRASAHLAKWLGKQLIFLRSLGISHNDIKPANILLSSDGSLRLTDFDTVSFCVGSTEPATRIMAGTFGYIPPDIAARVLDPNPASKPESDCLNDIFAMGVSINQILFGFLPTKNDEGFSVDLWTQGNLSSQFSQIWDANEVNFKTMIAELSDFTPAEEPMRSNPKFAAMEVNLKKESDAAKAHTELFSQLKTIVKLALAKSAESRTEALRLTQLLPSSEADWLQLSGE